MSRRAALVGLAVVLVAAGVGAYWALRPGGGGASVGGPLEPTQSNFFGLGTAAAVGERFSYGLLKGVNSGDGPAVLDRVELVGAPPQLEVVGSYAQPIDDPHHVGVLEGFPPPGASPARRPLHGYSVGPGEGVRVVTGVAARAEGTFAARALRLFYTASGRQYRDDWPLGIRLCVPKAKWLDRCEPPRG
jgi:hypothetical protein